MLLPTSEFPNPRPVIPLPILLLTVDMKMTLYIIFTPPLQITYSNTPTLLCCNSWRTTMASKNALARLMGKVKAMVPTALQPMAISLAFNSQACLAPLILMLTPSKVKFAGTAGIKFEELEEHSSVCRFVERLAAGRKLIPLYLQVLSLKNRFWVQNHIK